MEGDLRVYTGGVKKQILVLFTFRAQGLTRPPPPKSLFLTLHIKI